MLDKDFSKTQPVRFAVGTDLCDIARFEDHWIIFNAVKEELIKRKAVYFIKTTGVTMSQYQHIVDNHHDKLTTDFLIRCLCKLGRKVTIKVE